MLFDLKTSLNEGDEIEVTVTYDNGQNRALTPVKKVMAGMKHSPLNRIRLLVRAFVFFALSRRNGDFI